MVSHFCLLEAEFKSLANATIEMIWIQSILRELRIPLVPEPLIWCDNLSTVAVSANPVFHSSSEHFEFDLHFVREGAIDKHLIVNHVPSNEQVADILTKPLLVISFNKLRTKLTLEPQLQLKGSVKEPYNCRVLFGL